MVSMQVVEFTGSVKLSGSLLHGQPMEMAMELSIDTVAFYFLGHVHVQTAGIPLGAC